jgi:hypothetical protein
LHVVGLTFDLNIGIITLLHPPKSNTNTIAHQLLDMRFILCFAAKIVELQFESDLRRGTCRACRCRHWLGTTFGEFSIIFS